MCNVPIARARILMKYYKNQPLRFSIRSFTSAPLDIYGIVSGILLKEDDSKKTTQVLADIKELILTLDDFRTIFHLPQANDNNLLFSNLQISGPSTALAVVGQDKRLGDAYHNLQDDDIMKNIFNSGRNKNKVGMRIPAWMITEEIKLTEHYKMYAEVFGLDVSLTQSQPTERSAQLTPPVLVPSAEKADEMILQDTIQHLTAEEIEKLVEDLENVDDSSPLRHDDTSIPDTRLEPMSDKKGPEVEIVQEKEEETTKETEVEPDKDTPMVDIANIVPPVNVDDEEDEITDEVFELRRRVKGKNVEETRISPIPSPTRSPRNLSTLVSSDTEKLQELTVTHPTPSSGSSEPNLTKTNRLLSLIKAKPNSIQDQIVFFHELQGRYGYLFAHLKKRFMPRKSSDQLADNLHDVMIETLPSLVKEKVTEQVKKEVPAQAQISSQIQNAIDNAIPSLVDASIHSYMSGHILYADPLLQQQDIAIWLALQMKFEKTHVSQTACRSFAIRTRDQDDPHDDAHPEGENSAKRQKTSEYEAYVSGESSSGQVNVEEPGIKAMGLEVGSIRRIQGIGYGVLKFLRDMSGCSIDQKVKYTAGLFVGKALTWWNSQICTLSQEVIVSMSWNDFKFMMIEEFCPIHEMQKLETKLWNHAMVGVGHAAYTDRFYELARLVSHLILGALTDEAVRNGSIKKVEKKGNVGEPSKDKNGRDDNKRTRTVNAFATTVKPVRRENMGAWPKCTTCNSYHALGGPCRTCFNYNCPGHLARDCRVVPRNVNPVNVRNPTPSRGACYECGSTDHLKSVYLRLNRA
ncbi:putative reverse transcriptase domain-containing protein [Tanacetum coccineum]